MTNALKHNYKTKEVEMIMGFEVVVQEEEERRIKEFKSLLPKMI